MSNNDEFEGLIRSFNLDGAGEPKPSAPRRAFNYDENSQRTAAQQRRPAPASQPARRAPAPQASQPRQAAPQRPAQAPPRQMAAAGSRMPGPAQRQAPVAPAQMRQEPQGERKRSFQVRIDESEYSEAPASRTPRPARASGGGSGGGGRGGNWDDDDEHEPSEGGAAGRWFKAIVALAVVLGVSVFLAFFALESAGDLFGLNQPDNEVEFTLTKGLSMSEIASQLKEAGVVSQPLTFQVYAGLKDDAKDFVPGNYALNSNLSYDQILGKFRTGSYIQVEVKLMFYEGMTLSEMANLLEEKKVCTADDLYEYLAGDDLPNYEFLKEIPDSPDRFRRFEGYFFPDTYIFYENMSPKGVAKKFFDNFNQRVGDDLRAKMEARGMTIDQAITLASVIQKEAGDPKEMKVVSSVFHNRLAQGSQLPKLQSDVTRDYVNNYIKPYLPDAVDKERNPNLTDPNQAMYDAYNTYVCVGLPVGPVCNPGLDAIEAALDPSQTDYYYFVTDEDGTYYYAKTQQEHDQNVLTASSKGKVHGTDAAPDAVA